MIQNNCTLTVGEDLVVCRCLGITEVEVIEITRIKKNWVPSRVQAGIRGRQWLYCLP